MNHRAADPDRMNLMEWLRWRADNGELRWHDAPLINPPKRRLLSMRQRKMIARRQFNRLYLSDEMRKKVEGLFGREWDSNDLRYARKLLAECAHHDRLHREGFV